MNSQHTDGQKESLSIIRGFCLKQSCGLQQTGTGKEWGCGFTQKV